MKKLIDSLATVHKKDPNTFEAVKLAQERIDLFYKDNREGTVRADAEYNETGRSLSSQLLTFSTITIGLVSIIFGQEDLLNTMNGYQKSFLFLGLVSLFVSILAGALEHWDAMQHFKKIAATYARANNEAPLAKIQSLEELHEFKKNLFLDIPRTSKSRGLITQISTLTIGATLFLILFATIIFSKS